MIRLAVHLSVNHFRALESMRAERGDAGMSVDVLARELLENALSDFLRSRGPTKPPAAKPSEPPKSKLSVSTVGRSLRNTLADIAKFEARRRRKPTPAQQRWKAAGFKPLERAR